MLDDGLKRLKSSPELGAMKLWSLHHILLPQIHWDFMVYEFPASFVEKLETMVTKSMRQWLEF